jgi:hypothetical protein
MPGTQDRAQELFLIFALYILRPHYEWGNHKPGQIQRSAAAELE